MRRASAAVFGVAVAACAAGCSATVAPADTLTVYAAASLTDVFATIESGFEAAHPGVDVTTVFGGSAELAAQIAQGAPADVFASAHLATMDAVESEWARPPLVFATNTLTIAVPTGNPAGVTGLADLADPDVTSVTCAPQVPCGSAAVELAAVQGLTLAPSSHESSVTDVLGKVGSGQADAGVVYVTDIARAAGIEQVPIPGAHAVANAYPITALAHARNLGVAEAYVRYVVGVKGQAVLTTAGFGAP